MTKVKFPKTAKVYFNETNVFIESVFSKIQEKTKINHLKQQSQ